MLEREQTTIRLPAELKEQLAREAQRRGYSLNEMFIVCLEKGLEVVSGRVPVHR